MYFVDLWTTANATAVKLSCELLRIFITGLLLPELFLRSIICINILAKFYLNYNLNSEAIQRAAAIAEAEGVSQIEATHLERILPQLLLDF